MSYPTLPWETLSELITSEKIDTLTAFINALSPSETARAVSRLSEEEQLRLR